MTRHHLHIDTGALARHIYEFLFDTLFTDLPADLLSGESSRESKCSAFYAQLF